MPPSCGGTASSRRAASAEPAEAYCDARIRPLPAQAPWNRMNSARGRPTVLFPFHFLTSGLFLACLAFRGRGEPGRNPVGAVRPLLR